METIIATNIIFLAVIATIYIMLWSTVHKVRKTAMEQTELLKEVCEKYEG